jgi:hypothetical protein
LKFDVALSGFELLGIIVVGRCPTLMIQGFQPYFIKQHKKHSAEILQKLKLKQ